ncbi:MAG: hypothetical protein JRJ71_14170 [Deltaproteobacteria bacterium]|nr:hypothetical protein [Deltaproteobacteria bacterium]
MLSWEMPQAALEIRFKGKTLEKVRSVMKKAADAAWQDAGRGESGGSGPGGQEPSGDL